jgi:alkylation response protein AidB-like acyl-CoA dehydrogenase
MWTFNMPTDHGDVSFRDVRVSAEAILGGEGEGLAVAQLFVHENRIRQAASSLGAAQFCITEAVEYAKRRSTFGQPLAQRQAIQWPLVELATEAQMLQALIRETAWTLDESQGDKPRRAGLSDKISMCNYRANRLVCDAADRAMQVHGGLGYSRHTPFEHIYRHHRRYRITEGAEEIQIRRVAQHLFGFTSSRT